jgi:cellulose synthase/poly-beta-1,6-N-acetylglucosamine synthase-like glycosyltransferase
MTLLVSCVLAIAAGLLAVPVIMFVVEIAAAIMSKPRQSLPTGGPSQRVAVLVPAHNESNGILSTLEDIKEQLRTGDRLLVIADNCTDNTVLIAKAAGAEVYERNDPARAGKGYALAFGVEQLKQDPPPVVIIIDADCRVGENTIDELAKACAENQRPAQAVDLMMAPDDSTINYRVAEFAWRVKNWVRPLNLPCQLMGTGMAFPWKVVTSANLASGSVVEDLKLGLDLARNGYPALFCPTAKVTSHFPLSVIGARTQRTRWEQGHLNMIVANAPRLIYAAIVHGDLKLLALALDLAIPPLSLFVVVLAAMCFLSGVAAIFGFSPLALFISATCFLALPVAVFMAWLKYGRDVLPTSATFLVLSYVIAKLTIYRSIMSGNKRSHWIRTERKKIE